MVICILEHLTGSCVVYTAHSSVWLLTLCEINLSLSEIQKPDVDQARIVWVEHFLRQVCICLVGGEESTPNKGITFQEISWLAEIG